MVFIRVWQQIIYKLDQIKPVWWLLITIVLIIDAVVLLCSRHRKNLRLIIYWCILLPYLLFILSSTVFSRSVLTAEFWRDLFSFDISTAWTVGPGIYGKIDTVSELVMNILMFIPIGYLLSRIFDNRKWLALYLCLMITFSIELLQLVTKRGFFEVADLILNMAGAAAGVLMSMIRGGIRHDS